MDTLTIKGMKFKGLHGVHKHEKIEGNNFEVDVIFQANLTQTGQSDDLSKAIDYTRVHAIAKNVLEGASANLIEHLCIRIGTEIEAVFPDVNSFEVSVRKLAPPLSTRTQFTEARMAWPR
jgi:dihydroneopterin aldolase